MKTLLIFYIFSIAALVHITQTAPVDPETEVELVPTAVQVESEKDYDYDEEGFIPIFVIRRTEGSPFFGSFPFGNGNGNGFPFNFFDNSEDRISDGEQNTFFSDEIIPEIPLMPSFFDMKDQTTDSSNDDKTELCGFICAIMKEFDHKLKEIESNIKSIRHDQEMADINNSTYTEKEKIRIFCLVKMKKKIFRKKSLEILFLGR